MELIKLTHDNIDQEHICCAISSNKDVQVMSKKAWLKERLDEGLVFLKGNVRGKCFIEYIPTEYACGCPDSSRGMGTPTSCWIPASRTAKQRGKRGL